jgi:hypothetical protein
MYRVFLKHTGAKLSAEKLVEVLLELPELFEIRLVEPKTVYIKNIYHDTEKED